MTVRLVLALCALAAVLPSAAGAATKNGITPLAPKAGTTVELASPPTFRLRSRGKGPVWIYICKSRKRDKSGRICDGENYAVPLQAKRKKGNLFTAKPKFFDYPEFWLNSPGTYYWQAHRIDCTGNLKDCHRESPVVKFSVG